MYVSDRERRIEYLGEGWLNLPPGASCVWIVDGWEQTMDADGFDVLGKPYRTACSTEELNLVEFGHVAIQLQNPDRYFTVPNEFWFDGPETVHWGSEFRSPDLASHFHWFDVSGHNCGKIHCSYELPVPEEP